MKNVAIIFCLFISISAFGQGAGTNHQDTSKSFIIVDARPPCKHDKPLYVVDGKIYKKNIRRIDPDDILRIEVLKSSVSTKIYGKKGMNGVVLITTEPHQGALSLKNQDTSLSKLSDSALYVIDGTLSDKKLEGVDPKSIVYSSIIDKEKASEMFNGQARYGLVVVVTRPAAIRAYQWKLSTFSKKYKDYLQAHQNNDNEIFYILNGIPLNGTPMTAKENDEVTKKLYELPFKNIKKVGYSDNFLEGMKSGATIIITTKK